MNEKEYDAELDSIMDEYAESKDEASTSEDSVATTDDQTTKSAEQAELVEEESVDKADDKPQEENSESEEEATETTDKKPANKNSKHTGGINKKINKLTAQRRQAERESREAKQRYADLESRLRRFEDAEKVKQVKKPKGIEDFDSISEYQKHLAKEEAQKGIEEYKKQTQEEAVQYQEREQVAKVFNDHVDKTRQIVPDFDEVIKDYPKELPLSKELQQHLANSPAGPLTMYHMSCNEKVVDAISNATTAKEVNKIVANVHDEIWKNIKKSKDQTASTNTEQPKAQGTSLTPPKGKVNSAPPKQGRTGTATGELQDLEGDSFFNEFSKNFK